MRFATTSVTSLVRSTLATTLLVTAGTAHAVVRNVPAGFATIQDAINASAAGDTVVVAPGTYHERIDFLGKEIIVRASSFADPTLTVIDADLIGTAVTIGGGVASGATLNGFTIKQGSDNSGGGLGITGDPTIKNCIIKNCDATVGAGAYVNGNATFTNCQFISNDATGGGGLALYGNVTVEQCLFDSNHATSAGAVEIHGICTFADCTFVDNDATGSSSAEIISGTGLFDRCTFDDKDGAVITTYEGLFVSNSTFLSGATAVEALSPWNPVLVTIVNCTIHNEGTSGLDLNDFGFPVLTLVSNSIIGSDTTSISESGASVTTIVARSNVEGGWAGAGNIDADPQFVNVAAGDLRLRRTSPCIDAGSNALVPAWVTSDLDGNVRYVNDVGVPDTGAGTGAIVDMGAFETPCAVRYVNLLAAGLNDGSTWTDAYIDMQDALADAAATAIDYVLVAKGTYKPDGGTNNRALSFEMVSGTSIIGGFAGGETDISERDTVLNQTVLGGAIGGATTLDNSFHVVRATNVNATGKLIGFTIQKGNANGMPAALDDRGAGILVVNGAPLIQDCWIRQNEASAWGAGLDAELSDMNVERCRLNLNISAGNGSAISFFGGAPTVVNSLVHGNDATLNGAISLGGPSNALLVNSTIADNASLTAGCGGVYIAAGATLTMRNAIVWKNLATAGTVEQRQVRVLGVLDVGATSLEGWTGFFGGAGNDGNDPAFVNPLGADLLRGTADDDYRLLAASNAIDNAMSNWLPPASHPFDFGGADRFVDDAASANLGVGPVTFLDRGCYEFEGVVCPTDLNGDGTTDAADLATLLGAWGGSGAADLDGSGLVDAADLAVLLGSFGPC